METGTTYLKITIWVTSACNLRCTYCYEGVDKENAYMSLDTAETIVRWILQRVNIEKKSVLIVRFHGGEPMLNFPVIQYIIERLRGEAKVRLYFEMTTNGYNHSLEHLKYVCANLNELSISIDGIKAIHNSYRRSIKGEGTFEQVLKCAHIVRKQKGDVIIRMTINAKDVGLLYAGVQFLVNQGFENIVVVVNFFDPTWSMNAVEELTTQCRLIRDRICRLLDTISLPIGVGACDLGDCHGGIDSFQILPRGNIYPCPYAIGDEYCMGSVWTGIDEDMTEKILAINQHTMEVCKDCSGYKGCVNTRCKFVNQAIQGSFETPVPLACELYRRSVGG